jgi:hypothetical protein
MTLSVSCVLVLYIVSFSCADKWDDDPDAGLSGYEMYCDDDVRGYDCVGTRQAHRRRSHIYHHPTTTNQNAFNGAIAGVVGATAGVGAAAGLIAVITGIEHISFPTIPPVTLTTSSGVPTVSVPGTSIPTVSVPGTAVPTVSVPGTAVPTVSMPGTLVPTVSVPGVTVPTVSVPGPPVATVSVPGTFYKVATDTPNSQPFLKYSVQETKNSHWSIHPALWLPLAIVGISACLLVSLLVGMVLAYVNRRLKAKTTRTIPNISEYEQVANEIW